MPLKSRSAHRLRPGIIEHVFSWPSITFGVLRSVSSCTITMQAPTSPAERRWEMCRGDNHLEVTTETSPESAGRCYLSFHLSSDDSTCWIFAGVLQLHWPEELHSLQRHEDTNYKDEAGGDGERDGAFPGALVMTRSHYFISSITLRSTVAAE